MKIKIRFTAVFSFLTLMITQPVHCFAALIAAFLHELGHIIVARALGIRFQALSLTSFGAALTPRGAIGSYRNECFIALAGPAINFIFLFLLLPINRQSHPFLGFFALSSLFLGVLNLLPIQGFDGGRIFLCMLSRFVGFHLAKNLLSVSSFIILFLLWAFSIYLLLQVGASLSLFVFSCSLFIKLFVNVSS